MTRVGFSRHLGIVLFLLCAVIVAAWLVTFSKSLLRKNSVALTGVVLDRDTGIPIADARVIVTLVHRGFPYDSYSGYGVRANSQGKFALNVVAPHAFNDAFIEASAPNDNYGILSSIGASVTLKTAPLPPSKRQSPRIRYEEFRGLAGFGDNNALTFIDRGW